MILDWFNTIEAVAFAQEIASDVNRLFPPTPEQKKPGKPKKDQKKFDSLFTRTYSFAQQHKLNIYKKAKFLNTIKWALKDAGHGDAFINEIIRSLTPALK